MNGTITANHERIRGRQLQRIRKRVLSAHPLCAECLRHGYVIQATEVDHIIALTNGGDDDPQDDSNRQSLCADCHRTKTAADLGHKQRLGCDVDGLPRGKDHHWNKASA